MSGSSQLDAESERRQSSSSSLFPLPSLDPHKNRKSFLRESMSPPNLLKLHKKNTGNQVDVINMNDPASNSKSKSKRDSPSNADISLHSLHVHKSSPDAWQKQFAERVRKIQNRDKSEYDPSSKSCPKTSNTNTGPLTSTTGGGGVMTMTFSPEREVLPLSAVAVKNTDGDCARQRQSEDILLPSINYPQCKGEKKEKDRVVDGEGRGEGVEGEQPGVREGDLYNTDSSLSVASTAGLVLSSAHAASTTTTITTPTTTITTTATATMDAFNTDIGADIGPDFTQNSLHHIPTSTVKSSGSKTAVTTMSNSNVARPDNAVQTSSSSPLVGVKRSAAERALKASIAPLSSKSGCPLPLSPPLSLPLSPPHYLPLSPPHSYSHSQSREESKRSLSSDSSPLHLSSPLSARTRQRVVKADDALNPFESLLLQHTPAFPTTLIPLPGPLPLPVSLPLPVFLPLPVSSAPAHKAIIEPEPLPLPCSPKIRKDFTFINALMGKVNASMQNTMPLSSVKYPLVPPTPPTPQPRSPALTFEQKLLRVESQIPAGIMMTSSSSPLPSHSPSKSFKEKEKKGGGGRIVRAFSPMRLDVNNRAAQGEGDDGVAAAAAHTVPAPLTPPRAASYDAEAVAVAVHSSSSKVPSSSSSQSQSQLQRDAVSPLTDKRRVRIKHQHHERENIAKIANLPHYQQPLARSAVSGSRAKQMISPVTSPNPNPHPQPDTK